MDRRHFIKTTAASTVLAGTSLPVLESTANADTIKKSEIDVPAVVKNYTAGDHRRRLQNIAICNKSIRKCMRKHLITDYLPGQAIYNLGDYQVKKPWEINEYDEQELDRLRDYGVKLIQVHECWNDVLRLFGGNKFTPVNPQGFKRFVDMVHARGLKLIPYISTGYFPVLDPDFREEWARSKPRLTGLWNNYAFCTPASAGWRAYLLKNVVRILDEYGVDGLYNDWGYIPLATHPTQTPTKDEVLAFKEAPENDGAFNDLLSLIYVEVKRRGGIVKLNAEPRRLNEGDKVYDYLWRGEAVFNIDKLREIIKNYHPYVVPCLDMNGGTIESEEEFYLNSIPYMQFPLLQAGKPYTGEGGTGLKFYGEGWKNWLKTVRENYRANPNGPHTYGWWDSVPGRPETRPAYAKWLKRYLPLTEEGTWAWLEIADSDLFPGPLPKEVVASAFANRNTYLVLANYNHLPVKVETSAEYVVIDRSKAKPQKHWTLQPRSLVILKMKKNNTLL